MRRCGVRKLRSAEEDSGSINFPVHEAARYLLTVVPTGLNFYNLYDMATTCGRCKAAIGPQQAVWQCNSCYAQLHLSCIQAHAQVQVRSTASAVLSTLGLSDSMWSCPCCSHKYAAAEYPQAYRCFCGKTKNPEHDPWLPAHTCGNVCQRIGKCGHACTNPCHAGPCSKCSLQTPVNCHCGATSRMLRCGSSSYTCGGVCNKTGYRADGQCPHACTQVCHSGQCPPCTLTVTSLCACGRNTSERPCNASQWQCTQPCEAVLPCGIHKCNKVCHDDECGECLKCNGVDASARHADSSVCAGCGVLTVGGLCKQCSTLTQSSRTRNYCTRLKACTRHECRRRDCPGAGACAPCHEVCRRRLDCGSHTCQALCHPGKCLPCAKQTTVTCACGKTVMHVPCGNPKGVSVDCKLPCEKPPQCHHGSKAAAPEYPSHNVNAHTCHYGDCPSCSLPCGKIHERCKHACEKPCHSSTTSVCPPCTLLIPRKCLGGHITREIPCNAPSLFTCDGLCGQPLACARHFCEKPCHVVSEKGCGVCGQRCSVARPPGCVHACQYVAGGREKDPGVCHAGPCPPCKEIITVTCHCGKTQRKIPCSQQGEASASSSSSSSSFSCETVCAKLLPECRHLCNSKCHSGPCTEVFTCTRSVQVRCACGRKKLSMACNEYLALRKSDNGSMNVMDCDDECAAKKAEQKASNTSKSAPSDDATDAVGGVNVFNHVDDSANRATAASNGVIQRQTHRQKSTKKDELLKEYKEKQMQQELLAKQAAERQKLKSLIAAVLAAIVLCLFLVFILRAK